METQNISILLNSSEKEYSKFVTKNGTLLTVNQRVTINTKIQSNFLTSLLESRLCDYSDTYFLVTGNITVTGANNNTEVTFKNCVPFRKYKTEINDTFIDEVGRIIIIMPMYNLIEYYDNYSDTSGSLWQFKRDEIEGDVNFTVNDQHIPNNSSSFKYKSTLITNRNRVK